MELDKFKIYELLEYNGGYYIFNNKHYTKHDISYSNNDKSEKQIKELVGTKEDFIFTCISLQFNNQSLRDMTQADKKKFLTKIMKLNIFTEIYKNVKEKNTSLKNDEKKLKSLINNDIIYYETIINENNKIISQKNLELEDNNKKLNINNENIYLLTKKFINVDYDIEIKDEIIYYDLLLIKNDELKELNKELEIINDKINCLIYIDKQTEIINNYKTFIKEKNEKILNLQDKKMSLKYKLKIENTNDIEILQERNVILTNELLDLEKSIQMMNISHSDFEIFKKLCNINDIIKDISEDYRNILEDNKDNDIINVLRNSKLKYIEHFNDNTLLKIHEYINKQSELENNNINILNIKYNEEIKLEIENIEKELNILQSKNYEPYEKLENELKINDELNKKKNNIIKEINILEKEIKDIENIIKYKDDIMVNNNINKEIQEIKLLNEEINKDNKKSNNILIEKKCLLHTTKKDLEIYKNNKKLYIEIQKDLEKYKIIEKIISNDGIVLYILKKNIPIIENIINNIIVGYTNKTVKITIYNDNINIDFYQDKTILNCTGGKEQFIIELAFKIAISYIAVLPKANILFIDEGISVLDKNSIDNFNTIVDFLKEHYNNIYLITHIDKVKELFDREIIITKKKNRSYINNIIL
jgi:DNA repair exonuclease SbcCD ATPase subunit